MAPGGATIAAMLRELPEVARSDEQITIVWTDVVRATELGGLVRPTDLTSTDEIMDWVVPLTGTDLDDTNRASVDAQFPTVVGSAVSTTESRSPTRWAGRSSTSTRSSRARRRPIASR